MADEIALMRDGRIVQRGSPYNVYNAPADKAAAAFFQRYQCDTWRFQGRVDRNPLWRVPDAGPC